MTLNGTDTNSWGVWAKHLILGRGGGVKIDVFAVSLDFFLFDSSHCLDFSLLF